MKHLLIVAISLIALQIHAETYHTSQPGGAITKFEAMRVSFNNPKAIVYKCSAVKITEKGTLKNIPATGSNNFVVPPTEAEKDAVKAAGAK